MSGSHQGLTYLVVQTSNPNGWKWTVTLLPPRKDRTGTAFTRQDAIGRAKQVIERLTKAGLES
jgi:hypothetical protein